MTAQAGDTAFDPKPHWRMQLRQRRKALTPLQRRRAARQAARHALSLFRRLHARHVGLYATIGSELDTAPLMAALKRRALRVYLPHLRGNRMVFLRTGDRRCRGARTLDCILLPLLGFDAQGTRLGQGGGHYDRTLAPCRRASRPLRLGYAYAAQACGTLPREPHDVPLHAVVTEKGWRWLTG